MDKQSVNGNAICCYDEKKQQRSIVVNGDRQQDQTEKIDQIIGENLKRFREYRGISRKELADYFHIQEDSLYRIEKGDIGLSCEYCYILAKKLHCDMNFIFGISQVPDFNPDEQETITNQKIARILHYCASYLEKLQ